MDDRKAPGGGLKEWRRRGVAATMRGLRDGGCCDWASAMHRCMRPYGESTIMEIDGFASEYRDDGGWGLVEAAASMCLSPSLLGIDDRWEDDRLSGVIDMLDSAVKDGMDGYTHEGMMLAVLGWSWHQESLHDDYAKTTGNIWTDACFRLDAEDAGELVDAVPKAVDMICRVDGLKDSARRAEASGYPVVGPVEAASMLAAAIVRGLDPGSVPSAADVARICTLRGDPEPVAGWRDEGDAAWDESMIALAMYQDAGNPELTRGALSALLDRDDPSSMDGADFGEAAMTVLKALRSFPREKDMRPKGLMSRDGWLGRYVHRITAGRMSPGIVSGGMAPATAVAVMRMSSIIQRHGDEVLPIIENRGIMLKGSEDAICAALKNAMDMDLQGLPAGFVGQTLAYDLSRATTGHDRAVTRR